MPFATLAAMADELSSKQATEFFDVMYAGAHRDPRAIPWAGLAPNPWLVAWLARRDRPPGTALVVGSGLGDDAEELAERGWSVTAFDASPEAIRWARDRYPDSRVDHRVADLFDLPAGWRRAFDLVVDVRTTQSLPPHLRHEVVAAIASAVASGGTLLAVANGRPEDEPPVGPPWRLSRSEVLSFAEEGLELVSLEEDGGEFFAEFRRG